MNEEEKKAIEKLKERVKIDRSLRDKVESDFDKFCEDECIAIETVLKLIDEQNKVIDKIAFGLADYVMYYEYDKCRSPKMIKSKAKEIKEYYFRKVEENDKN